MPAIGRSPSLQHCRPIPRANTFASTRQTHSLTFPFLSSSEISHHRYLPYRPEQALVSAVPVPSLTLCTGNHPPRMRVDEEHVMLPTSPHFCHRRAGAPLALSSFSRLPTEEEKKEDGRKKKRRKRKGKKD
uniref:Uncharacterized protein n=1 Tax=Oryza barthii TaxID=65489 RepID=A0A0D3HPW1_9ORYZ